MLCILETWFQHHYRGIGGFIDFYLRSLDRLQNHW